MTVVERWIAKIGWTGGLLIALALSAGLNVWQAKRLSAAEARCEARIASMAEDVAEVTAEQETTSLEVGRETTERAEADTTRIQTETIRYVDRIRTVEVPVPAGCPRALPDRVQDALADAARAANRRL